MKTLKHGERGAEVKTLQRLLKERGFFNAYVGGNFLERTEAAVKAFQAANKGPDGSDLEVDGIVGKNTWWALENTPAEAAATGSDYLKYGDKGNEVLKLQRLLAKQGFFKDEPSGSFNVVTRDAVTYFQQSHLGSDGSFLDVDGVVGPATWWALRNPSGAPQKSGLHSAAPASLTPLRQRQLEIVLGEHKKGVKEVPDGSNWGHRDPEVRWTQRRSVVLLVLVVGQQADLWAVHAWRQDRQLHVGVEGRQEEGHGPKEGRLCPHPWRRVRDALSQLVGEIEGDRSHRLRAAGKGPERQSGRDQHRRGQQRKPGQAWEANPGQQGHRRVHQPVPSR